MERNICTHSNLATNFEDIYTKYTKCEKCDSKRSLKRYYENNEKLSNQRKTYYGKERDKLLQKQNSRFINFNELHRSCVELQNRLKTLEEKLSTNDSESN